MEVCKKEIEKKMNEVLKRMRKRVLNDPNFEGSEDYSVDQLVELMQYSRIDYGKNLEMQQWDNGYWYALSNVIHDCFKPEKGAA